MTTITNTLLLVLLLALTPLIAIAVCVVMVSCLVVAAWESWREEEEGVNIYD